MKVKKDFICICKRETFSPVSSINTDAIPDFVTFFVFFGNSLFVYLWNFFACYGSKPGSHFAHNLREFEWHWIIRVWVANQNARKTLSTVLVYTCYYYYYYYYWYYYYYYYYYYWKVNYYCLSSYSYLLSLQLWEVLNHDYSEWQRLFVPRNHFFLFCFSYRSLFSTPIEKNVYIVFSLWFNP